MKKGYKWSQEEKDKRKEAALRVYKTDLTLRDRVKHVGKDNGRYVDGHTLKIKYCIDCGKRKSWVGERCRHCAILENRKKYSRIGVKHTSETKKIIGLKSSAKFTEEYKKEQRKKFEALGIWVPLNEVEPYKLYCRKSNWNKRMFEYLSSKELILLKEKGLFSSTNTKGVVRDHMYSRYSGFKNNIPPILVRHPVNCHLITHADNLSKAKKKHRYKDGDSITLEQLFKRILKFKLDWHEQKECLLTMKNYKENTKMIVGGKL